MIEIVQDYTDSTAYGDAGLLGYGFGCYRYGAWFGFGQVRFRRWAIDICLLKRPSGYNKIWWTLGRGE